MSEVNFRGPSEINFQSPLEGRYGKYKRGTGARDCPMVEKQKRININTHRFPKRGFFDDDPRDEWDGIRSMNSEAIQQKRYNEYFIWALSQDYPIEKAHRVARRYAGMPETILNL